MSNDPSLEVSILADIVDILLTDIRKKKARTDVELSYDTVDDPTKGGSASTSTPTIHDQ